MAKHDMPLLHPQDVPAALGLLSRLPVPVNGTLALERGAQSAWAWPLAGLLIAAIPSIAALALIWIGLPAPLAAVSFLTVQILITGALHEDGLADCADGFWGGYDRVRRLEIMKDSRIGAYGVIAIGLSLAARLLALTTVLPADLAVPYSTVIPLMAIGMISRLPMVILMHLLPNARGDGLAQSVGRPPLSIVCIATSLTLALGFALLGMQLLPILIWTSAAMGLLALLARQKIAGQTGDVLGASQQISEIIGLFVVASLLT
ncbi:cobalamin-5'-phosphate synthase [Aliiroseovarius crassostreae]|nr:adenosylcobinamide-GDP ribazoletransferase [Aliiroseovarius crassostreae]SFU69034.1 cobalamin-5'-phosphate synthase [Aliiroseovarius crassostreae]